MKTTTIQTDNYWFGYFDDIPAVCAQAKTEKELLLELDICMKLYLNSL